MRQRGGLPARKDTTLAHQKLARIRDGQPPRVLDLFSGCGGLSLGLDRAGYQISAAVEYDADAARSHGRNFHKGDDLHSKARDITETSPDQLTKELGLGPTNTAFDVIVGGPPCQAFARVGRSKLREVADHPEAFRHDPRSRLYIHYLKYVEACAPLAVLMENVPDVLNHGGHNIAEEVCEVLESKGYICGYTLLNAAHYGVPQMRERMFLLAYRREVADRVTFPSPTHWMDLPPGYDGSRAVALKFLSANQDLLSPTRYHPAAASHHRLKRAVTAEQALSDLPPIDARSELAAGTLKRGARRFDQSIPYREPQIMSDFARLMRDWPRFEGSDSVVDHVIRYLPRDYPLFARLKPGDQYPEAHLCALRMFDEELVRSKQLGKLVEPDSKEWEELKAGIVPPYDPSKFPNKWRKMERDQPARTLLAHLGKDSYTHIHYDSAQARTISVREAARLQSFPDGFQFAGTMNPAFRQIGNAVPPLLASAIGSTVLGQFRANAVTATRSKATRGGRR